MTDIPEVNPVPDSSFSLPPDSVAYFTEYEHKRSRLTTFFRFLTVIPPAIVLFFWAIGALFVTVYAWFGLLFTAKFPEGAYGFLVRFHTYAARVNAYGYLMTDKYPGYNADEPYAAHLLIGPPKAEYSRLHTFFKWLLYIPFYIVAYVLVIVGGIVSIVSWFAIVITGKQPQGIQSALDFCFGYTFRLAVWYGLLTEDWPKFSDESVTRGLQEKGYQGTIPPSEPVASAGAAAPVEDAAPQPPTPPAPPAPPSV
ncbi:MAG: DUF4389 domain-containing protein [Solirubrobacterales bacterium]